MGVTMQQETQNEELNLRYVRRLQKAKWNSLKKEWCERMRTPRTGYQREQEWRRKLWKMEEQRRTNTDCTDLTVEQGTKIYELISQRVQDMPGLCKQTKQFCEYRSINYLAQLIQKIGGKLESEMEDLLNMDLQKYGLSLNTRLVGWTYPLTAKQRANLKLPITVLDCDTRQTHIINDLGVFIKKTVETLDDFVRFTKDDMLKTPNCGPKSFKEFNEKLAAYDLHFGMDLDDGNK